MRLLLKYKPYKGASEKEIDVRCAFGIHAFTPWMYNGSPPLHKVCTRCGEWHWHKTSWDTWFSVDERKKRENYP